MVQNNSIVVVDFVYVFLALYNYEGRLLSLINTKDENNYSKVSTSVLYDKLNDNIIKKIQIDLFAITNMVNPVIECMIFGIELPYGNSVREFGKQKNKFDVIFKIKQDQQGVTHEVKLKNFCLTYTTDSNIIVLGNFIKFNRNVEQNTQDWLSINCIECWSYKEGNIYANSNQISSIIPVLKREMNYNLIIIKHNLQNSCIFINELIQDKFNRTYEADFINNETKQLHKVTESIDGSIKNDQLTIPLNQISSSLYYLNKRIECSEQNMVDLWKMVNYVRKQQVYDNNEKQLITELALKVQSFENILLTLYNELANKDAKFKNILSTIADLQC